MLEARDLCFSYRKGHPILKEVSLALHQGQVRGISGPSGGGKSTLGRLLAGYLVPDSGAVLLDGASLGQGWCPVQYVHQNALASVDPRWRIGRIVEEGWEPDEEAREAAGVSRHWYDRYPHEVSGGELQRVALLRALSPQTRYLVADELTAMLDPVTQAGIWRFLLGRRDQGLGILAISHDRALLARLTASLHVMNQATLDHAASPPNRDAA